MKRRAFITLLGGAVAGWPLAARAQQPGGRRRLAVLMATAADDPESRKRLFALLQSMQQLGWVEGRNLRIDIRWAAGNTDDTRKYAAELIALTPDIILATGSLALVSRFQNSYSTFAWTARVRRQKRSMEARMWSADLVHWNGVGSALRASM
jgi:putative ABC transport system substrate-binding protein